MNKSNLVDNVSKKLDDLKRNDIEEAINLLILVISKTLSEKNRIEIRGFGSFSCRHWSARSARNPKTGTSISVNSKIHPYFRSSKSLRQQVNN